MVTSSALGYSPHPPVSVYGTVTRSARLEAFLGGMESTSLRDKSLLTSLEVSMLRICLEHPSTDANRDVQHPDGLSFRVPPSLKRLTRGAGILTCFPSLTPFGLSLGAD